MRTEPYKLPDGTYIRVDATASRGAAVIDFTLKGGEIVQATLVPPAEYTMANGRAAPEPFVHYRATAERAWDGDPWGNEWRLSWVVIRHEDMDGQPWAVYSDDSVSLTGVLTNGEGGAGNGDHCGSFDTFDAACQHADALAARADERATWGTH